MLFFHYLHWLGIFSYCLNFELATWYHVENNIWGNILSGVVYGIRRLIANLVMQRKSPITVCTYYVFVWESFVLIPQLVTGHGLEVSCPQFGSKTCFPNKYLPIYFILNTHFVFETGTCLLHYILIRLQIQ